MEQQSTSNRNGQNQLAINWNNTYEELINMLDESNSSSIKLILTILKRKCFNLSKQVRNLQNSLPDVRRELSSLFASETGKLGRGGILLDFDQKNHKIICKLRNFSWKLCLANENLLMSNKRELVLDNENDISFRYLFQLIDSLIVVCTNNALEIEAEWMKLYDSEYIVERLIEERNNYKYYSS